MKDWENLTMTLPKYSISLWSSEYIYESHAVAVTMHFSGVTISTSVSPTGCKAKEVRAMVKSCSARAWVCFPDFPADRSQKTLEEDAILNEVGYRR